MELNKELLAKAKNAKTPEELIALAKENGTEMTEEDNGRHKQTKTDYDLHRFKVPGLRNVALTAPYYHDGTRQTLDEAVSDMAKYQVGKTLPESDVNDLTAFLETLTGKLNGLPLTDGNALN